MYTVLEMKTHFLTVVIMVSEFMTVEAMMMLEFSVMMVK